MHIHDRNLSRFYPAKPASYTLNTAVLVNWVDAHAWSLRFSSSGAAGAATINFYLPLFTCDQATQLQQGSYVSSCDLWYRVGDDVASGTVAAALYALTLTAHGAKPAGTGLVNADLSNTAGYYQAVLALSPALWLEAAQGLYLTLSLAGTAAYNVYIYGARLNFELRR